MNEKDISVLLKKADELRALFVLGQRVIPFLEEIFVFVSEIQPLLDEINLSIEENLKKMPSASKQLSKVTEATELATTEIMDIVDGIVYKADIIGNSIAKLNEIKEIKFNKYDELFSILKKGIESKQDLNLILPELSNSIDNIKKYEEEEYSKAIQESNDLLSSISMDSSSIIMSLQVQDITSQQIAAVNNLLETIQSKLTNILEHFNKSDISDIVATDDSVNNSTSNVSKLHRTIAFDPDAVNSISAKGYRQDSVDELMAKHHAGEITEEDLIESLPDDAKEDDIDKKDSEPNSKEKEEEKANDSKEENSAQSQDDIDALFSGIGGDNSEIKSENKEETNNSNEESNTKTKEDSSAEDLNESFSQDDIDAMFGK